MNELLARGCELLELGTGSLSQNGMAGIAIVGFDSAPPVGGFVFAIVATETTWPVFMANVVGVDFPMGAHFREEVVGIDLLDGVNRALDPGVHSTRR
jgi:hypothetical protein